MKQGEEAGVQGTPSFYINGVQYSQGVPTVDAIKAVVEKRGS
jgi:protein-disulfide isomerase